MIPAFQLFLKKLFNSGETTGVPPRNTELSSDIRGFLAAAASTRLSARELDVAELMLRGFSYTEIGGKLNIAPTTVITHRKSLYKKMNIKHKSELFALVSRE